jgi:hypothetical protein
MADPDKKDEEALEEERLAKSLQNVKLHGRNAYAATHVTPPKKGSNPNMGPVSPRGNSSNDVAQPVSPRGQQVGVRGPKIVKDQPSGPLPEWKRVQLEREENERKRVEEEERRKRMYQEQIVHSASSGHSLIDTSSAMSGSNFVDPAAKKTESPAKEPDTVVPGKAIFDDKDKEEELRKEEEYFMRRTGSLVPKKKPAHHLPDTSLTGDHNKDAHLALSPKQQKVTIAWVDAVSGDTIQELPFFANGGRLPMLAVEGAFGVKNVIWKETNQPLTAGPDGFTTTSIGSRQIIEIIADRK